MTIVICVDTRYGMLFHRRRQSRDQAVLDRLLRHAAGRRLWMNGYSAGLFSKLPENVSVHEDFLQLAGPEDICFVENIPIADLAGKCKRLILYCWNRHYPADTYFPQNILDRWGLESTSDFVGNSHEQITEKIYENNEL